VKHTLCSVASLSIVAWDVKQHLPFVKGNKMASTMAMQSQDWILNEKHVLDKPRSFGIAEKIRKESIEEKEELLQNNIKLITTFSGPQKAKEYGKRLKLALKEDRRPIVQLFTLLNQKPLKNRNEFDDMKVMKMMKHHPEFCVEVYRFEAFSQDLLHPLHMLCALSAPLDLIKLCVKCCSAAIFHDQSGIGAPIHFACMFNASFDVVRWLVKKDSDALELPNTSSGRTPLHLAICHGADFQTIAFLTERAPEAALMTDQEGMTPLHCALMLEKPQLAVIEDLTEVGPQACDIVNASGLTPLLLGLQRQVNPKILRDLIVSNPKSVSIRDSNNATSLHLALERGTSIKVLMDLIRADPLAVKNKDENGNLPVHTAVQLGFASMDLYQTLAGRYPDGMEVENDDGMTPHQLAHLRLKQHPEIIEFLNPYE
jgi:Ankyrin repeats (3 copies)